MLKIAVFGTGGVGGLLGGLFARAGHSVHFIARGENLRKLQSEGLQVFSSQGDFQIPAGSLNPGLGGGSLCSMTAGPEAKDADLLLVCVKTWQLEEARKALEPSIHPGTLILPLQNGVEASEFLAEKFPSSQILRGFCAMISYLEKPGVIRHLGIPPYLAFGEMSSPHLSPRVQALKKELSVPGLVVETPEKLLVQQWQKFLFISSLAAVTSAAGLSVGPLRDLPQTRKLIEDAMSEVIALAMKKKIPLPSDALQKAMYRVDEMPAEGTTSMQRDFDAKRSNELETFSGYVAREGARLGIPTPIHSTCYALLLARSKS